MSTVAQLIDKTVRQHLEMGGPTQLNRLQSGIDATVEQLTLDWEPEADLVPGSFIEIGAEVMMVVTSQAQLLTVLRGQQGSTAASHTAADLIRIQPRFFRTQILAEMQDEIRSWPRSLFGVTRVNISWGSARYDADLTGALNKQVIRLLDVQAEGSTAVPWGELRTSFAVLPAETTDYASGWRLHTLRGGPSSTLEVTYAHEFVVTTLDETTDLQTVVGMSVGMEDIVRYGVAARLLLSQEGERARLDAQGLSRMAEEVPPQHEITASEALMKFRDKRLQDEEERLISKWGVM